MATLPQKLVATLRRPMRVDEFKVREAAARGARAEELMRNEAFTEAFEQVRDVYMDAWRNSDSLDVERRERCHVAVCLLDDIKNQILSTVRNGAAARETLDTLQR